MRVWRIGEWMVSVTMLHNLLVQYDRQYPITLDHVAETLHGHVLVPMVVQVQVVPRRMLHV